MELTLPVSAAVLGAALLHASWNVMIKAGSDKELETFAVGASSGAMGLVAALFLPAPASASWPWLAASAAVHILYFVFLAGAYRHGELGYTYPIMRGGGPMIVAAFGFLVFEESLPPDKILAVGLICAGILALASGAHDRRAIWFAMANAAVIAAYTLIDAKGARASGAPVSYTLWFFAANGILIGAYAVAKRGRDLPLYMRRYWARVAIGGALSVASYGIALWAMTRAPVALVAVLRETSVIFAAVIATVFLREKMTRRRLAATGAVLAGLVALRL